jgi:hypothetical protein
MSPRYLTDLRISRLNTLKLGEMTTHQWERECARRVLVGVTFRTTLFRELMNLYAVLVKLLFGLVADGVLFVSQVLNPMARAN